MGGAIRRPLSWSVRHRYLKAHGYRGVRRDFADFCLAILDRTYLNFHLERDKAAADAAADPDPNQ